MDNTLKIENNLDSILEGIKALTSYYCDLSNSNMAILNTSDWDIKTFEDYDRLGLIVKPDKNRRTIKFKPPKTSKFSNTIEQTYELLEDFVQERCEFFEKYTIPAAILLKEFSKEINRPVNPNKEFPLLMNKLISTSEFPIIKKSTCKGVIYVGLKLKPYNDQSENKRSINQHTINTDYRTPDNSNSYISPVMIPSTLNSQPPVTIPSTLNSQPPIKFPSILNSESLAVPKSQLPCTIPSVPNCRLPIMVPSIPETNDSLRSSDGTPSIS